MPIRLVILDYDRTLRAGVEVRDLRDVLTVVAQEA